MVNGIEGARSKHIIKLEVILLVLFQHSTTHCVVEELSSLDSMETSVVILWVNSGSLRGADLHTATRYNWTVLTSTVWIAN